MFIRHPTTQTSWSTPTGGYVVARRNWNWTWTVYIARRWGAPEKPVARDIQTRAEAEQRGACVSAIAHLTHLEQASR